MAKVAKVQNGNLRENEKKSVGLIKFQLPHRRANGKKDPAFKFTAWHNFILKSGN